MPTHDVVVFLSDRDLEFAVQPVAEKVGQSLGGGRTLVFACQDGEWSLVGEGFWGGGAMKLLQYFKAMASDDSTPPRQLGVEMCLKWLLWDESEVSQLDVDVFLAQIDAEPSARVVWLDFREQFVHWARKRGFQA